jgi:hypothetical protein
MGPEEAQYVSGFDGKIETRNPGNAGLFKAWQKLNQEARITLAALRPLGPCWHSNSTASPSFRVL